MTKYLTRFSTYTLLTALAISAVAEFYSIVGLTTIFAGAVIPTIVMGVVLGLGKIMATVWLKLNWDRAPLAYKLYLIPAIIVLMFLTSMGIFGFLSKSHSDQSLVSGDVQAKIAVYDEQIKTAKENIEANRRALKQMDEAVDQVMSRSQDERGAARAVSIRRSQQKERARLQSEIATEQQTIASLNQERAPIAAEVRKVENEVGPIRYIAAMIYGENSDANLLESAVRWVIILIVVVFDPLALILLLAAQQSFRWDREQEEQEQLKPDPWVADVGEKPTDNELPIEDDEQAIEDFFDRAKMIAREIDRQEEENKINFKQESPEVIIPQPEMDEVTESDPTINCLKCGTTLVAADGVGQFCPNVECGVRVTEVIDMDTPITEANVSSDEITVDSTYVESVQPVTKTVAQPSRIDKDIITDNVTVEKVLYHPNQGHITFEGKRMSIENLKSIRPDLVVPASGIMPNKIDFGSEFPSTSLSGDTFIRVDVIPHRVYKFNGRKWMAVDKTENTTYLTQVGYIRYLIEKLSQNEYDPELLTYAEQDEIEDYLKSKKT